jgi:hypothetical protein
MSADTPDDSSIPILTERLTLPPLELDTTLPQEPHAPTTSAPTAPLSLDTSLPLPPLNLGLPQPPPPLRPVPRAPAPAAPAAAPATRPAVAPPAPTVPARATAPAPTSAATVPPARAPTVSAPSPAVLVGQVGAVDSSGTHWSRIELALRSTILQAIADSLPQQIDGIVRNRMNDAIERLFTQLVAETRLAVAASLRDIVDQAVRAELARLRSQR